MPQFDGLRIIRGPLYKSALLLTAPLLCVLLPAAGIPDASTVSMFFLNMFLYLCFAYAVNDWADREADLAAGKHRTFSSLPPVAVQAIVFALCFATLAVGYVLSRSWLYVSVLSVGLLLGVAYSTRPLRFKGRGIWGVMVAPLLGKVIPVCLACLHYRRFGWYFLVVALAESVKNAIDILFHQIVDYENDTISGISTFPVARGLEPARNLLQRLAAGGILGAISMGLILAWLVPEYRWVFGAACMLTAPAVLVGRTLSGSRRADSPALNLPFGYIWFGGIVFLQSPMWLGGIAAWRSPSFLPLAVVVAVIALSQTVFYLRYRYH